MIHYYPACSFPGRVALLSKMNKAWVRLGILVLALTITFILLHLMKHLISTDKPVILLPPVIPPVIIFSPPEMDPPVTDKPKPPPHPEALPETPDPVFTFPESGEGIPLPVLPGPVVTVETGISDGAPMATLTITPEYPRIAVDRNLDGYVIVEFDISETGRVINPRVIESHPGTLFNRSALKAISRFRYKPMVVDGQPVEFYGAFYRFIYELDK